MINSNKKGFTLAEILITLGVIGLVAAATLPTLIGNHERKTWAKGLEKAYSTASQACQMALGRNNVSDVRNTDLWESIHNWSFADGQGDVGSKYFKNAKIREVSGDYGHLDNPRIETLDGRNYAYPYWFTKYAIQLPGSTLYVQATDYNYAALIFYVDVNGSGKDPNRAGADFFAFNFAPSCAYAQVGSAADCASYGDLHHNPTAQMYGCFQRVMEDGWEMQYDPILDSIQEGDY